MISIAIADKRARLQADHQRIRKVLRAIVRDAGHTSAQISIAIVDDSAIHDLNRRFLNHDYPTDVISFVLSENGAELDGEIVASFDTATRCAATFGWNPEEELLLYLIHGALHLVGYDDTTKPARTVMRSKEEYYLAVLGLPAKNGAVERKRGRRPTRMGR